MVETADLRDNYAGRRGSNAVDSLGRRSQNSNTQNESPYQRIFNIQDGNANAVMTKQYNTDEESTVSPTVDKMAFQKKGSICSSLAYEHSPEKLVDLGQGEQDLNTALKFNLSSEHSPYRTQRKVMADKSPENTSAYSSSPSPIKNPLNQRSKPSLRIQIE